MKELSYEQCIQGIGNNTLTRGNDIYLFVIAFISAIPMLYIAWLKEKADERTELHRYLFFALICQVHVVYNSGHLL